MDVQLLQPEII